jgi:hypothetical protein
MSGGEILFLAAFIGAMVSFSAVLAWADYQTSHRR